MSSLGLLEATTKKFAYFGGKQHLHLFYFEFSCWWLSFGDLKKEKLNTDPKNYFVHGRKTGKYYRYGTGTGYQVPVSPLWPGPLWTDYFLKITVIDDKRDLKITVIDDKREHIY